MGDTSLAMYKVAKAQKLEVAEDSDERQYQSAVKRLHVPTKRVGSFFSKSLHTLSVGFLVFVLLG